MGKEFIVQLSQSWD